MKNILLTFSALAATAHVASAATISINLVPDNGSPEDNEMGSEQTAGQSSVAASGWINTAIIGDSAGTTNVLDADGTGANFAFVRDGNGANAARFDGPFNGDVTMMNGNVSLSTINITGLPSAYTSPGYSIYVYFDDNNDGLGSKIVASDGTTTYYGSNNGNYAQSSDPAYVRATSTTPGTYTNGNYFLFEGLDAAAVNLTFSNPNAGERQAITGIQVVSIPEPSAALLGAFGLLGLLRCRR